MKNIYNIGDTIEWTFDDKAICFKGQTFSAEIALVNKEEHHYGVYAEYGQDHIPFNKAKLIKRNGNKDN